ncbi:hypothetical protein PDIG_61390 [Penicillium digitatum PHI26]|uniref:Aminotransferase class I/classII large domain-containing protein n=2 Tax=Penicillium digitatum TaxID=36651 RepID=K9FJU5_PEND2|nr:hypothetical protein PDIP_70820 [Penicillium digitatum Pd1]EKV07906.1 hypothetical protein PDIP_70820 [Penicillium digitatum Pd1]EKV09529.1 hypothetical protein PDIG_61390 [Penicillium digitatum PHI26]
MVKIEAFAVEQWMDSYETTAKYNTAETCCASISVDDLHALSDDKESDPFAQFQSTKLTYGTIRGSNQLRNILANLYSQLFSVPASLGAEVSLWKSNEARGWQLEIEEPKGIIRPNTKLIIINNPQNPTGAVIPRSTLEQLVDIAREKSIIIHSDEVYRPLFHNISPADPRFPPTLLSMGYEHTVVTGSVSKAYSLAGLRVGWIASRDSSIIESLANARD